MLDPRDHSSIVVLTGAGVSAESGIATFRDGDGLWEQHRIEDVATPEAYERDPALVWKFYSLRRRAALEARPNAAHEALARFALAARSTGKNFLLVTQNVDGLHERASQALGAPTPLAMHGTLFQSRCSACEKLVPDQKEYLAALPQSDCCSSPLRPHIVWFGEMPLHMPEIEEAIAACDLFVAIGTSGNVYPAAGFLQLAKRAGAKTVCLNKDPIPQRIYADECHEGLAGTLVPRFFMTP